jgi:hypothetical protein
MEALAGLADGVPSVTPYKTLLAFVCVPLILFLSADVVYSFFTKKIDGFPLPDTYSKIFLWNIPNLYFKFSPQIGIFNIVWSLIIVLFQASYIYKHLGIGTDLQYYLKIDIPEYETVDLINLAEGSYSLYYYMQNSFYNYDVEFSSKIYLPYHNKEQFERYYRSYFEAEEKRILKDKFARSRISQKKKQESQSQFIVLKEQLKEFQKQSVVQKIASNNNHNNNNTSNDNSRRRLSSTSDMALIYHTDHWDNMFLENNLIAACQTEKKILANVGCLNLNDGITLLGTVFDENCEFTVSYQYAVQTFTLPDNSDYVADNVDASNPESAVVGSLFKAGTCQDMSLDSFESQLSGQSTGGVDTVYLCTPFITTAFTDAIINGVYLSVFALVFGSLYILISVRGLFATFIILYSILVAVVNAAALLINFEYGTFSAFNVLSVFILIGVGGNAVVMFGASWRESIPTGQPPKLKHFMIAYDKISRPVLFVICAATISLFSKLISPVIVISQLGAFMGISVLVFYVCLHYIIIPMWLTTGWFHLPKSFHIFMRKVYFKMTCQKIPDREELGRFSNVTADDRRSLIERPPAENPTMEIAGTAGIPQTELLHGVDSSGHYVTLVPSEAIEVIPDQYRTSIIERQHQQQLEQQRIRKKKEKYYPPSSLKRVLIYFNMEDDYRSNRNNNNNDEEDEENLNNNQEINNNNNPLNPAISSRLYSPLIDSAEGANFIPDSSDHNGDGLIHDSLPNENALNPTLLPSSHSHTNHPNDSAPVKKQKKNKKILKCFSCCVLFSALLMFLLVGYLMLVKYKLDLGVPQLFPKDSNMGQVLYIVKNYKSSLLTAIDSAGTIAVLGSDAPTMPPVISPPSAAPTATPIPSEAPVTPIPSASPIHIPPFFLTPLPTETPTTATPTRRFPLTFPPTTVSPSFSPSVLPTDKPTYQGTAAPSWSSSPTRSFSPTAKQNTTTNSDYVDYMIDTCWGLTAVKEFKDSDVNVTFDGAVFMKYVTSGSVMKDMKGFCNYVNENRANLNVRPSWDMTTDCIYQQVLDTYNMLPPSFQSYVNALLYWASKTTTSAKLLGMDSTNPGDLSDFDSMQVTWLCANYSARTYTSSMLNDPDLASTIQDRWKKAFRDNGAVYASQYGVNNIVSSDEFSFPLLAKEVIISIELAILISVIGFLGLLVFFASGDVFMVILGTIGMCLIFAIAICCKLYVFDATMDLLDVVVLIAIIGIVVDLPIHYILHYKIERQKFHDLRKKFKRQQRRREARGLSPLTELEEDARGLGGENKREERDAKAAMRAAVSPELNETNKYMRTALLQLLILTLICGIPLLFATFVLLQKTGQYIVIIAVVSYFFTIILLPYLMAVGFQTKFWKFIRLRILGWEETEEDEDDEDDYDDWDMNYIESNAPLLFPPMDETPDDIVPPPPPSAVVANPASITAPLVGSGEEGETDTVNVEYQQAYPNNNVNSPPAHDNPTYGDDTYF